MKCFELKSGSRQFSGRKIGVCLCEVSRRRVEPRDGARWRGDKWDGEMEINNVICVRWRLTKQSQDVLPQSTLIMKTGLDILSHYQYAGALNSPSLTIRQRWADVTLISSRLRHSWVISLSTVSAHSYSWLCICNIATRQILQNIWEISELEEWFIQML